MMKDILALHYEDKLEHQYDCIDRIILDVYIPKLQMPGGFRNWYRDFNRDDKNLTTNRLIKSHADSQDRLLCSYTIQKI